MVRTMADDRDDAPINKSPSPSSNSSASRHIPQRSNSGTNITLSAHRQSFADGLRNGPSSPRHRPPSLTQAAVQELMNHPPSNKNANPRFAGREWRDVTVGELVSTDDVRWIELDSSVEEATMLLLKSPTSVVLVRENVNSKAAIATFDYNDLNSYLLIVIGRAKPEGYQFTQFKEIQAKAQQGEKIPLRAIQSLLGSESIVQLSSNSNLVQSIEIFGSGIHRILVADSTDEVIGVMSQLRVVDFFWNEGINFPTIERVYPAMLRDLNVGNQPAIHINSDAPLSDALSLMNEEGLSSVAVVDNGRNVVGNISTKDVRNLTSTSSAPLLGDTCMHFISVILNERGVEKGKDAFPVFYVSPTSTLAHTVAKLVATRSHRMWIVESASPGSSVPATPTLGPQVSSVGQPPASSLPGASISGKLIGVISLTDVLNVFAKSTGLHPGDPEEQRARRRRSSSSSMRPSLDFRR